MMLEKSIKNPTTQPLPTTQLRLLSPMRLGVFCDKCYGRWQVNALIHSLLNQHEDATNVYEPSMM